VFGAQKRQFPDPTHRSRSISIRVIAPPWRPRPDRNPGTGRVGWTGCRGGSSSRRLLRRPPLAPAPGYGSPIGRTLMTHQHHTTERDIHAATITAAGRVGRRG
jgi:hypothetical protein